LTGDWRKIRNGELQGFYCFFGFIRVMKLRRMRWAGHVARVGSGKCIQGEGRKVQAVDRRIILKWLLISRGGFVDWVDLRQDNGKWWAAVNRINNRFLF
jgi:hypothetical protein